MGIQEAYQQLMFQLYDLYDDIEAANITDMVIEHITGQRKIDRITNKTFLLSEPQLEQLNIITEKLLQHTPVQYALHETWFAGMRFYVDKNVLIPRPETEELVEWIINEVRNVKYEIRSLIDIGTGSGCIPIALKKKLSKVAVSAIDVSEGALNVARKNAALQQTKISFYQLDFLDKTSWNKLNEFDIIVSNPPYVKQSESASMQKNVLNHEPHLALFVHDEDALLFYRNIAEFAEAHLSENGLLFFEINEALGKEVSELLISKGYNTAVKKDMQGKDRMIKAFKS